MSTPIEELREKIAQVTKHIEETRKTGSDKKASALAEYKQYLEGELRRITQGGK